MLEKRAGNCLGLPLLIGAILGESGITPNFRIVVNPQDIIYEEELKRVKRLEGEMRYDDPELATIQNNFPIFRFSPLEHLVIETEEGLIETTSEEHFIRGYESARQLSFQQALSCVYKDRAIAEGIERRVKKMNHFIEKGLELWPKNRQLQAIRAKVARLSEDAETFEKAQEVFKEIHGDDSLYYYTLFNLTSDENDLDKALKRYPAYAEAIAHKARLLIEKDEKEARFQYALASQLYADSNTLSLADFYITHNKTLKELFGVARIRQTLTSAFKK